MRSGFPVFRLSPEPWIGMSIPYDKTWMDTVFKAAVTTRAWDAMSKTWWFMRSFEPVVSQLVREKKVVPDEALERARVDLYRDRVVLAGESRASDYAILGLHPSAPAQLIDWALAFWRQQYNALGAPPTKLMEAEEAYTRILSGAPKL